MTQQDTPSREKIAIVTGANTGIGLETSRGLAQAGYRVILACRNEAKAQAAIKNIQKSLAHAKLDALKLDLIDRQSIRAFASQFSEKYDHLDVLINNAGVMCPPYTITPNNLELQLDANHMGHFYLTHLLLDKLDQDYETRILNVSSIAGKNEHADIHFDNINFKGNYEEGPKFMGMTGMLAYSQSKLANLLFTMELKNRFEKAGKQIKAIAVHPGVSNTDLSRNIPAIIRFLLPVFAIFMNVSKPNQGAESSIYAATRDDVNAGDFIGPTGKREFTGPPGKVKLPAKVFDQELCTKFWDFSENELNIQQFGQAE